MNGTGKSLRILSPAVPWPGSAWPWLAAAEAAPRSPPVSVPPSSAHTAAEQAAVMNWLFKTNQMWTSNDFAAVDQITAGQMNTLYQSEQRQASLPKQRVPGGRSS